jgi:hypothetical protein
MTASPVARVWIYDAGVWRLGDDPTGRHEGDAAWTSNKEAGYELSMRLQDGMGAQHLEMWTRPGLAPECQIIVNGEFGQSYVVYATRLPEGFDLMVKWEPLVTKWVAR